MRASLQHLLTHRLLWGLIGVTALSCVLWMLGPLWSWGDTRPLEPVFPRQLAVGLLYFCWVLFQFIPAIWRGWFNSKLLNRLQEMSHEEASDRQATETLLTQRFSEAALRLKRTQFGRRHQKSWLARFQSHYLYQLPWYVMIGAPGAGKTTALLNAGLEFPLTDSLGKEAVRGVGGTRHCDWWFTDSAVLIDTAGRYALQESQRARDGAEWHNFIKLLKRYRTRQPINGVIMTISVADLLTDSAEARHAQASALRSRMVELHQQTGIHFPVYVMVTKTDLLKGFMSFYGNLSKPQRDAIWGFTFPWEPGKPHKDDWHRSFSERFQQLEQRLQQQLADVMAGERDLTQRADSFLFPQEFSSLRPLLNEYLDVVFSRHQDEIAWSARGLFFTSGTQEGLPFDRIMGELNRKLQLPHTGESSLAAWDSVNRSNPIPGTKGQSFFIRDLLSDLVFRESGLAGSNRHWEYRNRLLHWIGYGALTGALVLLSGLWLTSYVQNQRYLDQVAARIGPITAQSQQVIHQPADNIFDLLPFLNNLVKLPLSAHFSLDNPPLTMRAGLYRGNQVSDAAWVLYQNALKSLLLPRVAQQITNLLRDDPGTDNDYSRNALRAYQMLYQPRNYDGEFLRGWLMQNLQRTLPDNVSARDLQQLDWHLSQLLDQQIQSSPYARDNALMMRKLAENLKNAGQNGRMLAVAPHTVSQRLTGHSE
ncbi:type VI secretion system protein ImpL [Pantoea dispersa EGD-AAK13]|jgi:type VI secretion system protein ImpL|uniref:Type VI secretion system membrane subunit TssM n=1 Tax=Pantoea dispersa TaxID=59814 RepID=A0ABY3A2D1_9GAMM|nr:MULTISPECIES: type VI secretion system membrane subunit TssM [Pantoea]ERH61556.1 type VI secretion system protein ImpL [Pantoea dispersa EGD-AAK13]KTS18579.1 type VI secretion system protein ImpL [Pantoea dispersa]KTS86607.1 type VI secretion system protein ImpL [Pantoea dispersa]MBU6517646.1 type VI secretion system membrane subunit TssM [Pantoea sp. B270]MBZ6392015.1 type VI secretion system membrane subunit TssM [Pantoea dispersa]